MNSSFLPTDEVKRIAADILSDEFGLSHVDPGDLGLVQADDEPGAEVWTLEWYHPAGTPIDSHVTVSAMGEIASRIVQAGDPRLVLLRHRFHPANANAA
jgi:hypothetical protein